MQVYPMLQLRVCVCVLGIAGLLVVTVFVTLWRSCWQQRIENWLDSKWEFDCRPLVKIKFRPEANYYGIHVRGLPLDAAVQDVERFFLQFGALHPSPKVHILPSKDGEAYVNFVQLAAAERVLNASCHRSLWFEGAVLIANAGRNMDQPQPSTVPAGKGAYKTRLCRYHEEGRCFDGAACNFAHGEHELSTGFSSRASSCSRSSVSHSVSSSPSTSHLSPQSDVNFSGSSVTPRFLDPQRGLEGMHVGDQGHMARLAAESLGEGGESKLSAFPLSHHLEPHSHDSEPPGCSGMLNGNAPIAPSMLNPNVAFSTDGIAIRQQQQMNPMPEERPDSNNDPASGGPGAEMEHARPHASHAHARARLNWSSHLHATQHTHTHTHARLAHKHIHTNTQVRKLPWSTCYKC